jgi:hypothetical protein
VCAKAQNTSIMKVYDFIDELLEASVKNKWMFLIWMLLTLSVFLIGCGVSLQSPVELIRRPQLVASQQVAREVIDANVPDGAILIRPLESNQLSSVGFIDWNGDGSNEVYAFYRNSVSLEAGVMILSQKDGKWEVTALVQDVGVDIAFAEFVDFNLDGYLDIVLGLTAKDDSFKSLVVFEWNSSGEYVKIFKDVYTELKVIPKNENERALVVFKLDRNQFASATLLEYSENRFNVIDSIEMDPFINGYYSIQYAKASKDYYGFFIDFRIGSKSASNIMLLKDGKLELVFDAYNTEERYMQTMKDIPIVSRDVNGDGIVEIGSRILPYIYDEKSPDPPYLNTWYQWDGEDSIKLIQMNYSDEVAGFRLDFPERWKKAALENKLTIVKSRAFVNKQFIDVYFIPESSEPYKILTIEFVDKDRYDAYSSEQNGFVKLGVSKDQVFIAYNRLQSNQVSSKYREISEWMLLSNNEIKSLFVISN